LVKWSGNDAGWEQPVPASRISVMANGTAAATLMRTAEYCRLLYIILIDPLPLTDM
jgi:hypothetical protein